MGSPGGLTKGSDEIMQCLELAESWRNSVLGSETQPEADDLCIEAELEAEPGGEPRPPDFQGSAVSATLSCYLSVRMSNKGKFLGPTLD